MNELLCVKYFIKVYDLKIFFLISKLSLNIDCKIFYRK
jgi:hypothetical protein